MALTAIIVVIISVVVERSGPFVGALIAALPTAAGAAYIILAFEHPPELHCCERGRQRRGNGGRLDLRSHLYACWRSVTVYCSASSVAIAIWFVAAAVLRRVAWTPLTAALLNVGVFGITVPLSWRYRTSGLPAKFLRSAYDIPLRALTAAIVVAVVTTASYSIGSFASGVFAVFPIVMGCSAVILHPRVGGIASASMFAHAQIALNGLWLGFLAMHYLVAPLGVWWRIRARADGVRWLERAAVPDSNARYESPFASCALSA